MGKRNRIGVQRKQFPADLLSSLADGRLYGQLPSLTDLDLSLLVIEGHGRWTEDGELIADKYHQFTIKQLHGLLFSIMFEFGVPSIWVADMKDTADVLMNLEAWAKKAKHTSLKSRPGPDKSSWGSTSEKHLAAHVVQGFPGVGQELAGRIVDKFEGVPLAWTVEIGEMMTVEGIGEKKASMMYGALKEIGTQHGE